MSHTKIILIAGPTGAGKSALALDLAAKKRGMIINADAMQIYAGLPILSNQPDAAEQKKAPHRLYAALDAAEHSSAGRWLDLARAAIKEAVDGGYTPILVGGTGLYFKALFGGLADIPKVPGEVRVKAKKLYEEMGEEKFRAALAKLDPDSAKKLARNDQQRLIRAYEVALHSGKPIGHWQKQSSASVGDFDIEPHLLMPPRDEVYAACNKRFHKMIERGAVEEAKAFLKRKLDPPLGAMKTIGLREIGAYLDGEITLDETIAKAQQMTRNYAKRQMTWFRNQWKVTQLDS
jgi:tRNA dimethylallyltransferase